MRMELLSINKNEKTNAERLNYMMKQHRFRQLLPYIQILKTSKSDVERRHIMRSVPNYILDDIVEILYNILHKNVLIRNRRYLDAMNKHKASLVKMFNIYSKKGKRRTFVRNQSGGFLGAIIPIIASVLASKFL